MWGDFSSTLSEKETQRCIRYMPLKKMGYAQLTCKNVQVDTCVHGYIDISQECGWKDGQETNSVPFERSRVAFLKER